MAKKDQVQEEVTSTPADATQAAPKVEIIRGRIPVAIVACIRYKEPGMATAALAAKYRTTVGKVDDILKGRNFGYVTAEFQPTEEQKAAAIGHAEQLIGDNVQDVIEKVEAMGIATDGGAAFEAARKADRKTTAKPAEVPEGGDAVEESDMSEFTE
jgi:hypothetical protein